MAQLERYRFVRCTAGSVTKWTWISLDQLEKIKQARQFSGKIGDTTSKHWRLREQTSLEIDGYLLPYILESTKNDENSSSDVEEYDRGD